MFEWVDDLYRRVRHTMPASKARFLDEALDHGAYGVVFGDSVEAAVANGLLTQHDRTMTERVLDFGLLRKAKPYFMDLIAS